MTILNYFEAREGKQLAEFDYAQLEIRVLALASMDKQLILDINNGQDMHTYFASRIYNKPEKNISKQERKIAKGFSFQLQYGAGAKGIARFWDVEESMTKRFIDEYYTRYPDIKAWQDRVQREAEDSLEHRGDRKDGESVPRFSIPSIWRDDNGRPLTTYTVLGDISEYKSTAYVSPTKCKNYPIQGGAADIMFIMLNTLRTDLRVRNSIPSVTLLNTVHDSVLIEFDKDDTDILDRVRKLLETVPSAIRRVFKVISPINFPVDVSTGFTLAEVKNNS
jgi:DNA polymerase-1